MSKRKILYIVNSLVIGGTQRVVVENANYLDSNRFDSHIVSLSKIDKSNCVFDIIKLNPNINLHEIDFNFYPNYSLFGYLKLIFKKRSSFNKIDEILNLINSINPDIIHFHTSPRELILRKHINFKSHYVFTDHTLRIFKYEYGILKSKILSLLFKKLYSGFHILTVSDEIKKNLYLNGIVSPKKPIIVVKNGIDLKQFCPDENERDFEAKGLVAVYVSRITHAKGHSDLIKAWALLKDIAEKKLYIVGPDELNGEMQKLSIELNCEDSIVFTGSVFNPKFFLREAQMAFFPSYKEGLPLALLEKMAVSLPVIVSDIPELKAIIIHNENGLTFELGNINDLAAKIRYLYLNPIIRRKIGSEAKVTIEKQFNNSASHLLLNNFYERILLH